jgi:GT2 family glycosyltransferase
MEPKIGIIILNWNNIDDTIQCLDNLQEIDYPKDCLLKIVVDNRSTDEIVAKLHTLNDIYLIQNQRNLGFAGGNNPGILKALESGCEYILLLNNDTYIPPNTIKKLLDGYNLNRNIGIVCPKMLFQDPAGTILYAGGKFKWPTIVGNIEGYAEKDEGQYDEIRVVDYAIGSCMLIHNKVIENIGLLDTDFFFYHEDVDFCIRAKQSGFAICYQPEAQIIHVSGKSTKEDMPLRTYLNTQARIVFYHKHIPKYSYIWVILFEVVQLIKIIAQNFVGRNPMNIKWYFKGLIDGFKGSITIFKKSNNGFFT